MVYVIARVLIFPALPCSLSVVAAAFISGLHFDLASDLPVTRAYLAFLYFL